MPDFWTCGTYKSYTASDINKSVSSVEKNIRNGHIYITFKTKSYINVIVQQHSTYYE